jgi:hypothetical protein
VPDEDASEVSQADDMPLEQIRLVKALLAVPTEWTLEGEWQRRNTAVEAIIAYCGYAKDDPLRDRPKRSVLRDGDDKSKPDIEIEKPLIQGCFQCGK